MRLWRISNHADLSGEGGRRVEGRWHERGRRVVYLSEHPALALLEAMVHLEIDVEDLPKNYQLLEIDVLAGVTVETMSETDLDAHARGWRRDARIARAMAASWFVEARTALLQVPSVVVPNSSNFLLNPLHADASRMKIVSKTTAAFDERLFPKLDR